MEHAARAPARGPRRRRRRRLVGLYQALRDAFGPQHWWPARSAFEVVVGAILTQNTAWANVERAIANLRAAGALSPQALRDLPLPELARLVRPSGYFNIKARRLRAFIAHLWRRHDGDLRRMLRQPADRLRAELLAIPGIGPETADSILLYAAGRPVFVVDAYTRRILARHRLVPPRIDYEALRAFFEGHLPHDPALFNEYHALLVRVGKEFCRARPRCEACPLRFDLRGRPPRRPP
ncbi:MAG: endonuclease III domain-containing protein [Candidatus Rokubacteria bacterium]|nr:endonuclease III domain-containing protein [Candidatus Rokubacteria bacterium]